MIRYGFRANFDKDAILPKAFAYLVGDEEDEEEWGDEMEVFYNPWARIPLPPEFFPDACQHRLGSDFIDSRARPGHSMMSVTMKFCNPEGEAYSEDEQFRILARAMRARVERQMGGADGFVRKFMAPGQ